MFTWAQYALGKIAPMSAVGSATSALGSVGAVRTAIQIAVPQTQTQAQAQQSPSDFMLEAAVQRVATLLYMRSRFEVPPDVIDMGGGVFNVVV
jgi:hypothetical protein